MLSTAFRYGASHPFRGLALRGFVLATLAACGSEGGSSSAGSVDASSDLHAGQRELPDFMFRPGMQDLVNHRIEGRIDRVVDFLRATDPILRSEAALLLVAGGHPAPYRELSQHVQDGWPAVRADVALALGWVGNPDGGRALVTALRTEADPDVRPVQIRSLGRQGDDASLAFLVGFEPESGAEEAARLEAIGRMVLRDLQADGAVDALIEGLHSGTPEARALAAWSFGRSAGASWWAPFAPALRDAFDALDASDMARGGLVVALGRLGSIDDDLQRVLQVLAEAPDWRIRVQGTRALAQEGPWLAAPEVQDALIARLADTSPHVAMAAAEALREVLLEDDTLWEQARTTLMSPAVSEDTRSMLYSVMVARGWVEPVVEAAQQTAARGPRARALVALEPVVSSVGFVPFRDALESQDGLVAAAAAQASRSLWERITAEDGREGGSTFEGAELLRPVLADALLSAVSQGHPAAAATVAPVLAEPPFLPLRGDAALEEAIAMRHLAGITDLTSALAMAFVQTERSERSPLLSYLVEDDDYRTRRAVAMALSTMGRLDVDPASLRIPSPERTIGWVFLSQYGPYPRLEIETSRGRMLLKLDATQAPLTVQTLIEQANAGLHDGTSFHRVVPNFVIQAGDIGLGDGTGGPGYRIQTEPTRIPFERGVIGMASSGPHTEGSQWFITHSSQPHLDGSYTSFGWLLEGWDVLDAILEGDQVRSMRVQPDPNWSIPR